VIVIMDLLKSRAARRSTITARWKVENKFRGLM
jgi:hypothetical protein